MPSMFIRNVPEQVRDTLVDMARARRMSLATYFNRLLQLHIAIRAEADAGDQKLQDILTALGLQSLGM